MTRREVLLRQAMDLALLSFKPTTTPTESSLCLAKAEALHRTAQALGPVTDGGDRGATDRWFADIEALAEFEATRKAKPPRKATT